MGQVSLDALDFDLPHALAQDEAGRRVERAAAELCRSWARWNVKTERQEGALVVAGAKGPGRFAASLVVEATRVVVKVSGKLELSFIELAVAGGEKGVRGRVKDEVTKIIRTSLESA